MSTQEQKNLPFERSHREEPDEKRGEKEFSPEENDERRRLQEMYGEGAEKAALTSKERKKKHAERKKKIEEWKETIRRSIGAD